MTTHAKCEGLASVGGLVLETVPVGIKMQREEVYFPGAGLFTSPTLELELPAAEQNRSSHRSACVLLNAILLPSATNIQGHLDGPSALATLQGGLVFTPHLGKGGT